MTTGNIESGIQLFSRLNRKTFLEGINPHLFSDNGPLPNKVIEITGDQKVDKNDLLIDFIVKCILPSEYNSTWKSSGAVLILCEHQINIFKIIKVIETHLANNNVQSKSDILESSLKNLTIYNCYTPEELEVTIMSLERLILANDNINLIVIDNINSYYWLAKQESNRLSYYQHSLQVFQRVFSAIKTLNVVLIYVRSDKAINSNKKVFENLDFRINIEENDNGCLTGVVTDFPGQTTKTVQIKLNKILEFM